MFKSTTRISSIAPTIRALPRARAGRRFVSTAPPHQKSRSWRSSAARWGLAGALVYYYNAATVFAEEPTYAVHAPPETSRESETYQTVASVAEQRRAQARSQPLPSSTESQSPTVATVPDVEPTVAGSPEALEEEAGEQGAFNEETGEINWECPCLGGMAHGPCGEQFRAAFSCFVFSKGEPKGVDCIEHFKTMQNCFREHPDVYGAELDDDDAPADEVEGQADPISSEPAPQAQTASTQSSSGQTEKSARPDPVVSIATDSGKTPKGDVQAEHEAEEDEVVPKAWHDSRDPGTTK